MLHGNLEPDGYFANPPAFTYLLAGIFKIAFGARRAHRIYRSGDPTEIWVAARVASAVLGALAVWLLYLAGARLFDRRTGLLAGRDHGGRLPAGLLRQARAQRLADARRRCACRCGAAPASLRLGRRRDFVIAGLGLGLAAATKYTGGIVVLPLVAAALGVRGEPGRRLFVALWTALAGVLALAAFVAANPYARDRLPPFINQDRAPVQRESEGNGKLGLTHGSGIVYYLWSLTWGVGWVPSGAAALGRGRAARAALVVDVRGCSSRRRSPTSSSWACRAATSGAG